MKLAILGTGGHADAVESAWGGKRSLPRFEYPNGLTEESYEYRLMVGLGGVDIDRLTLRLHALTEMYGQWHFHKMISHRAIVSQPNDRRVGLGIVVMPMAYIGPATKIGNFVIVNVGASVHHGVTIGAGTHVAPGAVVAGDAEIGRCCFIGANAVVPQDAIVPPETFIKAGEVFKGAHK